MWAFALVVGAACAACDDAPNPTVAASEVEERFLLPGPIKLDLLIVVDSSESMCEEQQALSQLTDPLLERFGREPLDVQIAVITTDMVDREQSGRFRNIPDGRAGAACTVEIDVSQCPAPPDAEYPPLVLRTLDPRYQHEQGAVNTARLQRDLACSMTVGTRGSPVPMGMEAARTALDVNLRSGYNSTFLRDEAFLAIVFVSDRDDCSLTTPAAAATPEDCSGPALVPVGDYVRFFADLKGGDTSRLVLLGIVGPPGGCESSLGAATPAPRYVELINSVENRGLASVCEPPFDDADVFVSQPTGSVYHCLAGALSCTSDADCDGACVVARDGATGFCDPFQVEVELERDSSAPPLRDRTCRIVDIGDLQYSTPGDHVLRCVLLEGVDYTIDYAAELCSTSGPGIELIDFSPGLYDRALVFRYPRATGD